MRRLVLLHPWRSRVKLSCPGVGLLLGLKVVGPCHRCRRCCRPCSEAAICCNSLQGAGLSRAVAVPDTLPCSAAVIGVRRQRLRVDVQRVQQHVHLSICKLVASVRKDVARHDGGAVAHAALLRHAQPAVRQHEALEAGRLPCQARMQEGREGAVQRLHAGRLLCWVLRERLLAIYVLELAELLGTWEWAPVALFALHVQEALHIGLHSWGSVQAGDLQLVVPGSDERGVQVMRMLQVQAWGAVRRQESGQLLRMLRRLGTAQQAIH
mmetsp:Transcript_16498/g.41872  ORF Transcript_16498/g.41872 Transcript_16498/m.41872 type:complete len:267 (-) Transcript_16498:251-1051(-)